MITPASDRALLVSFGQTASEESQLKVMALVQALKGKKNLFLREIQPAYSSVLLTFDPRSMDLKKLTSALQPIVSNLEKQAIGKGLPVRQVKIAVCYEGPCAPDLGDVAKLTGLAVDEVVRQHSSVEYTVCFFGFMPGFSYWSGLPERLAVPRLATPRLKVAAGSVGIGGSQTGIYPLETAGGWRIIGRTPIRMFDPAKRQPCFLRLGDRVRLVPISPSDFERLATGGKTWGR